MSASRQEQPFNNHPVGSGRHQSAAIDKFHMILHDRPYVRRGQSTTMSFFSELQRRNVIRVAIAYIIVAWLVMQVSDVVISNVAAPGWVFQVLMLFLAIGLPLAMVFAWAFELTPEGLKREYAVDRAQSITQTTGRKLNFMIIGVLMLALAYFAFDKFVLSTDRDAALIEATTQGISDRAAESESPPVSDKSIAVLPFVNMSDDAGNEYFSDGLSEELLNLLAKVPELRVTSRSSAFSYKGKDFKITDVGRELNVSHVLEGSVRKAGNQVRITAQLILVSDDIHLWSETYDRSLDNIFTIQDEIAAEVVARLKITLLGDVPTVEETDPKAYALHLQARHLGNQQTAKSLEQSNAFYQEALAIDPDYVAAWNGLATNYTRQAGTGLRAFGEGYTLAREASNRALVIDPTNALAQANLAWIAMYHDGDLAAAARYLNRAYTLEPDNPDITRIAAILSKSLGRINESIALQKQVVALDPVNPIGHSNLGLAYLSANRPDDAIAAFHKALVLSPERIGVQYSLGVALLLKGESEAALEVMQQESFVVFRLIGLSMAFHALGRPAEAEVALTELIEKYEQDAAYNIAYIMAFRGEADRAFEWLEKSAQYNDPGLPELLTDPLFTNIHNDSRWLPFLERIGKSPQQLDAIKFEVTLSE
jgi:TolB-like protein/Flp pilus assembly protein TadD